MIWFCEKTLENLVDPFMFYVDEGFIDNVSFYSIFALRDFGVFLLFFFFFS